MTPEQIAAMVVWLRERSRDEFAAGFYVDSVLHGNAADLIEAQATMQAAPALPRLTQGMIEAACVAHYGKRRVSLCGSADGVSMTVDGIDHSFTTAFRRMWSGVRAHIRSQKGGA